MPSHVFNIALCTLLVLPDINDDNSYCIEMQKPAILMYAI